MKKLVHIYDNRSPLFLGIPFLLLILLVWLCGSTYFDPNISYLSLAISADFVLTIPIIYFLTVRKTKVPNFTAVSVAVIGLFVGLYVLPQEERIYLKFVEHWILPFIEFTIVGFVIFKVRTALIKYKKIKAKADQSEKFDFYDTLQKTCREILPKLPASLLATEIAVFYYSLLVWKNKELKSIADNEFTHHKNSGTIGLLGAIVFIIAIETIAIHLLLAQLNSVVAWVLTIVSIYTGFQMLAFAKSLPRRFTTVLQDRIVLKYGIMSETNINLDNVLSIELTEKELVKNKLSKKLSILGDLEAHNIIIKLKKPATLKTLYGREQQFTTLAVHLDQKAVFKQQVDALLARGI